MSLNSLDMTFNKNVSNANILKNTTPIFQGTAPLEEWI
jgi:hypothetical protein